VSYADLMLDLARRPHCGAFKEAPLRPESDPSAENNAEGDAVDQTTDLGAVEPSIPIMYIAYCGNFAKDGQAFPFIFSERVPESIYVMFSFAHDADRKGRFLTSLIERHNEKILVAQPWRCQLCGKEAKELYHSAMPFLAITLATYQEFELCIVDIVVPICASAGRCDHGARQMTGEFQQKALEGWCKKTFACETCGSKTGLKRCNGCKTIR
jgi:hypothetical protein